MRKSLNDNPLVAVGILGVLGVVVAFLLLSGMSSSSSSDSSSTDTTAAAPVAGAAPTTAAAGTAPAVPTDPATAAAPTDPAAAAPIDPATGLPAAPSAAAAPAAPVGKFVAGPGLPAKVVSAYEGGNAVALLVVKKNGIDDKAVAVGYPIITAIPHVATFETLAKHVARYSRVTEGVDLDRVPALVVIRPKKLTGSGPPQATVTYGFNGPAQLAQAVFDSLYKGPEDLPYYPQ